MLFINYVDATMNPIKKVSGLTAPDGEEVYEFFFKVKSRPGVLGAIASLLGEHNVDILGGHIQVHDRDMGIITLYADISRKKESMEEIVSKLRSMELMLEVDYKPMSEVFFEHFYFPMTSGGHFRIFALSADAFMALEKNLYDTFGEVAGTLLYHSGRALGKRIVEKMRERRTPPEKTEDLLLRNLVAMLRAYGVGLFKIQREDTCFMIEVEEPLMSVWDGEVMDYFTIGVAAGALEEIYNLSLAVKETKYIAEDKKLEILLAETQHAYHELNHAA